MSETAKEKPTAGETGKKIFKYLVYAVILFVYGCLIFRSFMSCDAPIVDKVLMDEQAAHIYREDPDAFTVEQYGMREAFVKIADGRMLSFDKLYYLPKANQLQVTVKFNTDIASEPTDELPLSFYLVDETGNEYHDYFYEYETRFQYGYARVSFRGIELSKETELTDGMDRKKYQIAVVLKAESDTGEGKKLAQQLIYDGSEIFKQIDFKWKDE